MATIDENLRRVPPQSVEAEESVLGGIMLDNTALDRVVELVQPDDFYRGSHQRLFRAMLDLSERSEPVDLITLSETLKARGELTDIGGTSFLADLAERVPTAANIVHYARIVRERSILRGLIEAATEIATRGYQASGDVNELLDRAEQLIFGIQERKVKQAFARIADVLVGSIKLIERLYEQKQAVTGVPTGFSDLDALTSGLQPSDLIIVAGRPSMGKCLTADAEIVLSDGSVRTIEELVRSRSGRVLTLTDRWKLTTAAPSAFVDDGVKPAFEVTTRLGRRVGTTLSHPFLTVDGWKPLAEIRPGDRVAVPRRIDVFGTRSLGEERVKLLAYLLGGGTTTGPCPRFTHRDARLRDDFVDAESRFASRVPACRGTTAPTAAVFHGLSAALAVPDGETAADPNPLTRWLQSLGLWGRTAATRFVPAVVFTLDREEIACFLNRLFATDGWATVPASGQARLGFSCASERMARQVQHLLLRFGVIASLKHRRVRHPGGFRSAFRLDVTDASSVAAFVETIGIFGKETALARVKAALEARPGTAGHDVATGDVYWDEVVGIRPIGARQVYDLTIPGTHNFVANDVCVHNTAFCLNIAENAALRSDTGVAIFSLEMAKEQLAMRMLCSEARVDLARVRTGHLSDREFPKLAMAAGRLADASIFIDDTPALSVLELRAKARRLKRDPTAKLGLVIVDYIQLMRSSEGKDNREQEISEISRSLKALAKELQLPVVALSQLNRQVESRNPPIPRLADLRESGAIEQDADVICFLYREEYYVEDTDKKGVAQVIVAKQRNGPTGNIDLTFLKEFTRFENREIGPDEEMGGGAGSALQ